MTKQTAIPVQAALRFAIYCRYSDEAQNDVSLESQEAMCREEIARRNGVVVKVYNDAARVGWSLDREDFEQMRLDAERRAFDAIMMWKFDRLARDHTQVTAIKALIRHEYDVRLYCVEGFSEDDDSSPYTAMMEQLLAIFSAFYSKNLSNEVKRANRHRHSTGKFNDGKPPFGYLLATEKTPKRPNCFKATTDQPPGLYIDPIPAQLVEYAYTLYSQGDQSYRTVALAMTDKATELGYPQDKPFNPQMVRELLQNRIYCGYVSYVETIYKKGFGQGKAGIRGRREWTKGIHESIISERLFNKVQDVRAKNARAKKNPRITRNALLSGIVFCTRCIVDKPPGLSDDSYGKMYIHVLRQKWRYYECSAKRRGYQSCGQRQTRQETIDEQVITALHNLHQRLPENVTERIDGIMRQHREHANAMQHIDDIRKVVERVEISWEHGFMDEDTYLQKRRQLQIDMEMLRPLEQDDLLRSASLLKQFDKLWEECTNTENQQGLIRQILDKVIVFDKRGHCSGLKRQYGLV